MSLLKNLSRPWKISHFKILQYWQNVTCLLQDLSGPLPSRLLHPVLPEQVGNGLHIISHHDPTENTTHTHVAEHTPTPQTVQVDPLNNSQLVTFSRGNKETLGGRGGVRALLKTWGSRGWDQLPSRNKEGGSLGRGGPCDPSGATCGSAEQLGQPGHTTTSRCS